MPRNSDIDRIDFDILGLLMNDARLSNKEIAAAVGLAPSSCYERLKTLRSEGVLRGFHADVDLASIGLSVEALLFVQVAKLDAEQVDNFVREIASVREVRTVFLVSGHFDLIVHLAVRDMEQLKLVISENFNRHACVLRVETSVVFNRQTQYSIPTTAPESYRS
jgi:DNA-binding Lrp family transcriptional regulator